ncbi:MAG: hypothetical protein ACU85V_04455 [Gammaproteobacteria bacterium]
MEWLGGFGAWETPGKWSSGSTPTADDFVEIGADGTVSSTAATNVALELVSRGTLDITAGALTVHGTIDSVGTTTVGNGALLDVERIFVQAGGALSGDGAATEIRVLEGAFNSGRFELGAMASLAAESFDNFAHWTLTGEATASANSMINHTGALLEAEETGSTLRIAGDLTNDGLVEARDGATLAIDTIDNLGSIMLASATLSGESVGNDGSIALGGAAAQWTADVIVTNRGDIDLAAGAGAALDTLDNRATVRVKDATLTGTELENRGGASVTVAGAGTVDVSDLVLNRGALAIGPDARVAADRFQQLAGTTRLDGGTLAADGPFGVDVAGGTLSGHGTIDGVLRATASGTLAPGDETDPTARFDVLGALDLGAVFAVELGGTGSDDYDVIGATGAATLGGALDVALLDGFAPQVGDFFDIILAASTSGAFGAVDLPALAPGLRFDLIDGGTFFRLAVAQVPLPAPGLLLAGALVALAAARRRQADGRGNDLRQD